MPSGWGQDNEKRATLGAAPPPNANHNNPGLDQGIKSGFAHAGSLMASAASMGMGMFPGGGAAGGLAGSAIQSGMQMAGQAAASGLNILSSLGVGTLTPGTTSGAYGSPLFPQKQAANASGPRVVNQYGDIHTASYDQFYQGQQRREAQDTQPYLSRLPK